MGPAILISIRPEWVAKILSEEKTLEIRKTRPNIVPPFKCYIYCTHKGESLANREEFLNGKVIAEFTCDKITWITHIGISGVPGIKLAAMQDRYTIDSSFDFSTGCLTTNQIDQYLDGKDGYAWSISGLKIYRKPKKLSEYGTCYGRRRPIARPPQSWCYVEELGNDR